MGAAFRGMDRRRGQVVAVAGGAAWIAEAAVAAAGRGAAVAILVVAAQGLVVGVAGFALAAAAVAAVGTVGEVPVVVGAKRERGRTRRRIRVGPLVVGAGQRAHALRCLGRAPRGAVAVAVSGVAIVGVSSSVVLGGVAGLAGAVLASGP